MFLHLCVILFTGWGVSGVPCPGGSLSGGVSVQGSLCQGLWNHANLCSWDGLLQTDFPNQTQVGPELPACVVASSAIISSLHSIFVHLWFIHVILFSFGICILSEGEVKVWWTWCGSQTRNSWCMTVTDHFKKTDYPCIGEIGSPSTVRCILTSCLQYIHLNWIDCNMHCITFRKHPMILR